MNHNLIKLNQGIFNRNRTIKPYPDQQYEVELKRQNVSKKTAGLKKEEEKTGNTAHTIQFSCKLLPSVNESLECKYLGSASITVII